MKEGAERAGRTFSDDFFVAAFTSAVVLKPGETLTSDRVIDECGSYVTAIIHFVWEIYQQTKDESVVPEAYKGIWDEYCASVEKMETPRDKRYLQIHNGHCTFLVPEERRFVTPETIKGTCLVGEPDEIIHELRESEKAGLQEVTLLPAMDQARNVFKDFAQQVIERY